MPRDATATRVNIMDAAEALILHQGFSATSVDKVIDQAGITKGTFFYHFKTKNALAHALVKRHADNDAAHLDSTLARAEGLSRDPVQQILIFAGLLREEMLALKAPFEGCLYASYCYEAGLFDDTTMDTVRTALLRWRGKYGAKLAEALDHGSPRLDVDADSLADMLMAIYEGAFILNKTLADQAIIAQQLGHYRNYLELLFAPKEAG